MMCFNNTANNFVVTWSIIVNSWLKRTPFWNASVIFSLQLARILRSLQVPLQKLWYIVKICAKIVSISLLLISNQYIKTFFSTKDSVNYLVLFHFACVLDFWFVLLERLKICTHEEILVSMVSTRFSVNSEDKRFTLALSAFFKSLWKCVSLMIGIQRIWFGLSTYSWEIHATKGHKLKDSVHAQLLAKSLEAMGSASSSYLAETYRCVNTIVSMAADQISTPEIEDICTTSWINFVDCKKKTIEITCECFALCFHPVFYKKLNSTKRILWVT